MSDLTIATANQSPNQVPGAAGNSEKAGGSRDFLEMLRGSSAHHLAKGSLLFAQGRAIDTTYRPAQGGEDEDLAPLPGHTAQPDEDKPKAEKSEPADKPQDTQSTKEPEQKQAPEETAAVREGSQIPQSDAKASERSQEGTVRADAPGKPAASPASREPAPAPNVQTAETPEAPVPPGKDSAKAAQNGQGAATVERAGLVSKPQQTLAQTPTAAAVATAAGETARKTAQPTQATTEGNEPPSARPVDPRTAQEPVIRRPTPSAQPVAPGGVNGNTAQSGNAAAASLFAPAVAEAAAGRNSTATSAATAPATTPVAAAPKASGTAMPVTAGTGEPLPLKSSANSKATSFAGHLKGNAETVQQLSQQLGRAAALGKDRISLQLHPSELGRVDVKLEFAQDQSMRAVITADRPETLELLQRDARALERALQDAGVKLDNNALNFAHREDQQAGGQLSQGGGEASPTSSPEAGEQQDGVENSAHSLGRASAWQGAVNIEV